MLLLHGDLALGGDLSPEREAAVGFGVGGTAVAIRIRIRYKMEV